MGFFSDLGKILSGKPVGDQAAAPQPAMQPMQPMPAGPKVIPVVRVVRAESPIQNGRMQVNLQIKNESPVTIWLDKVLLLGTHRDLNDDLAAGQSYEFQIYSGPPPQNDLLHDAEVQYRTQAGDYFSARHQVLYDRQSDGLHVKELRLITPIKDLR